MTGKGFTILELMVVIGIIAILAAISIPMYSDYTRKTKVTEAWEELQHVAALQEQIFTDYRSYDTSGERLNAYGATFTGKYFVMQVSNLATWTATAYVCFDGAVGCSSTAYGIAFSINRDGTKKTIDPGNNAVDGWKY